MAEPTRPKSDQNQQQNQQQRPPASPPPRGARGDRAALQDSNLSTLKEMFAKMAPQLTNALPKFMTAERMIRVATTTVQRVPKLLTCHPVSIVGAVMQSAALGLEPDNITGSAYLVPFWNTNNNRMECSLIPGYRGLMALARRSREITAFDARVVKRGDLFEYEYGSAHFLRHKQAIPMEANKEGVWETRDENDTIAAYAIAYYGKVTGGADHVLSQFHVMLRGDLEKHRNFTKSRDRGGEIVGPWIEHPDAMRTKTVIRQASKLLPFSIELMTAVGLEERAIAGKSQNLGALAASDLGVTFEHDEDPDENGEAGAIDPELVKRLDAAFTAIGYTEARKTTKMQEFRGRLPELLLWLEAEALKKAKPAGESSTAAAGGAPAPGGTLKDSTLEGRGTVAPSRQEETRREDPPAEEPRKPRASGRWRV